ncbi:amidase family protein, partial [Variovorax sp. CT11-76]
FTACCAACSASCRSAPASAISRSIETPPVRAASQSGRAREAFGQNVSPASIAALPSVVLPAGFTREGLPVGIAFDAPHGSDARLLALAQALQQALQHPPEQGAPGAMPGSAVHTLEPQALP